MSLLKAFSKQFDDDCGNSNHLGQLKSRLLHHPLISTGFDGSERTELTGSDADEKSDLLLFINQEERDKLLSILAVFSSITVNDDTLLYAEDIYEEGILIRYLADRKDDVNESVKSSNADNIDNIDKIDNVKTTNDLIDVIKNNPNSKTVFLPFKFRQFDAFRRLFYLAVEAQLREGKLNSVSAPTEDKQHFTVTGTTFITPNMVRIHIKSDTLLPSNDAGYAYRFALTGSNKQSLSLRSVVQLPFKVWNELEPKLNKLPYAPKAIQMTKQYGYLAGLEILKRQPTKRPNKVQPVGIVQKRYYTLRQLKQTDDGVTINNGSNTNSNSQSETRFTGEVDVYIHDDTAGSVWATSLKKGDEVHVDNHYHETIKNMTIGQPLFICDETSMPSVAAVLERWQEASVPVVIQITNNEAERAYFDEVVLPATLQDKLTIHHIDAHHTQDIAQSVIDIIEAQNVAIDCAWGAIGSKDYRAIKKYLKETHGLKGKLNRVRAYWVAS